MVGQISYNLFHCTSCILLLPWKFKNIFVTPRSHRSSQQSYQRVFTSSPHQSYKSVLSSFFSHILLVSVYFFSLILPESGVLLLCTLLTKEYLLLILNNLILEFCPASYYKSYQSGFTSSSHPSYLKVLSCFLS